MAKKKAKSKFPYEKVFVRHVYAKKDDGARTILYVDEIAYTVRSRKDEVLLTPALLDGTHELLNSLFEVKVWDKDEIAKNARRE